MAEPAPAEVFTYSRVTREQEARGYGADPELHDHCVIANLALRKEGREAANGRWGAIDSRELMLMQIEAGTGYRAQLAAEIHRLGYEIDLVGTTGRSRRPRADHSRVLPLATSPTDGAPVEICVITARKVVWPCATPW